jgi:hypothetical protein
MAGTTRAKREAGETSKILGHRLGPFTQIGDKTTAHCENPACNATVIIQDSRAEGYALTQVCPFLEQKSTNGYS